MHLDKNTQNYHKACKISLNAPSLQSPNAVGDYICRYCGILWYDAVQSGSEITLLSLRLRSQRTQWQVPKKSCNLYTKLHGVMYYKAVNLTLPPPDPEDLIFLHIFPGRPESFRPINLYSIACSEISSVFTACALQPIPFLSMALQHESHLLS